MDGLHNVREISFHTGVLASYQRLGQWEPREPRGSLPFLREPEVEVPPGCSTRKREPGFLAFLDRRLASAAYCASSKTPGYDFPMLPLAEFY